MRVGTSAVKPRVRAESSAPPRHLTRCIYRKVGKSVRSRVYYTTSLEHETQIESGGCAGSNAK